MSKSRFFVEQVKCGVTDNGIPGSGGDTIVTIKYRKNDGPSQWLSNAGCMGYCNIYLNDFDPFDLLVSGDEDDPKFGTGLSDEFEGIEFDDYEEMFEAFEEDKDNPAVLLLRYLVDVTYAGDEEAEELIKMAEGKYIDEIDVPISELEDDYWADKGYRIDRVKCELMNNGIGCGPGSDLVVAAVQYTRGFETKWLTNVEAAGVPNFYLSDEDIFDKIGDEEATEKYYINKFENIALGDYRDIDESIENNIRDCSNDLIKFVVLITRCNDKKMKKLIKAAEGEYLDEIDGLEDLSDTRLIDLI